MHVLIIAQYFPPDLGGSATRAYNIAKGLVENGVNVTILTAFPHYPSGHIPSSYKNKLFTIEHNIGYTVIRGFILPLESRGLGRRLLIFFSFILSSTFCLFFIKKIDGIWVANPDIFGTIPALIYKAIMHVPIIYNVDDLSIEDTYNLNLLKQDSLLLKIIRYLTSAIYTKIDAFTPISPGYVSTITRYGARKKIMFIPIGVDVNVFFPIENVSNNKFRIIYSGSFSVAYDFDQILHASQILPNDVEFIIQGKGELDNYLINKVNQLKQKNVKIINKLLSRESVATLLNKSDVLILPLRDFGKPYLGISSKLYEYQAVNKPVICCSYGQSAQYIKDTDSGLIVPPGDHESLAKTILYLKENHGERRRLGDNGYKYINKFVTLQQIGSTMKMLLNEIIKKNSNPRL